MSQLQFLNVFLTERLTAVAMEISVVLEQNLGEYQEEISRSNEENKRLQNLLDLVFSSEIKLHREDSQQLSLPVSEEEVPPEQQHCEQESSPSQRQEDPEPTQIKEEQEELRTSQEEEQPQGLEPDTKDLLIPACVKSDYEQDPPLPSHLDQTLENRERDSLPTNTTEQIKTEPDGEDYRGSEPTRDSQLLSEAQVENIDERVDGMERHIPPPFSPDSQQPSLSVSKEEVPPEQQERSPRLGLEDPEPTKQEELWTNQEEQQRESDSRVSEPTSDSQLLSAVNPDCSAALGENRVCVDGAVEMLVLLFFPPDSQQLSLPVSEEEVPPEQQHCEQERSPSQRQEDPEPTLIKEEQEELRTNQEEDQPQGLESEIRVSEPTSLCRVLEPTILCKVLESTSVANPDCSAAQSEKIEEYVDGLERPILPSYPPELPVFEEEVPPEQQERSPCLQQEDPEPTKVKDKWEEFRTRQEEEQLHIGLSESTSLCRVSEPTLSVANTDCSEAQVENIDERVDGMERHIPPPFSPDSQQPSLSVSKEEVPPEQQERIPRLGLEDPEPTKQEELWTIQEEQQLESDSRLQNQTCLPPILSCPYPLKDSPRRAGNGGGEHRTFLTHLEKPGLGNPGPRTPQGTRPSMEDQRSSGQEADLNSLHIPSSLVGILFRENGGIQGRGAR
ncbi:involucrin-like [Salvelinus alpinus]|uniref:involucrin-like n=1 Tax=Salvelinus alpinus TaxID=8036 RepID=UPI0039FDA6CC